MSKRLFFTMSGKSANILEVGLFIFALIIPLGLQVGSLGFYGDDWANVLFPSKPASFPRIDGLVQNGIVNLFGNHPLPYYLIILLMFLTAGLLLHKILLYIGLDTVSALASVILFLVFPGFMQPVQVLALIPILLGIIFALTAVLLFVKWVSFLPHRSFLLIGGLISSILVFLLSPFSAILLNFALFICFKNWKQIQSSAKIRFLLISAYILLGIFCSFLFFSEKQILNDGRVLLQSIRVWLDAFVISWRQILAFPQESSQAIIYLALMFLTSAILYWIFRVLEKSKDIFDGIATNKSTKFDFQFLIFAAGAGLLLIILSKFFNIPFSVLYPDDLGMVALGVFGAVFITLGIKLVLVEKYRLAVLTVIIVLSIGTRFLLINRYVVENSRLTGILAQLSIRGDIVKEGTVLVSEQIPLNFTSQSAIDALLQKMFNGESQDYSSIYISANHPEFREMLRKESLQETELELDSQIIRISKDALLGFWVRQDGCVELLDNKTEESGLPQELKRLTKLSSPDLLFSTNLSDVKQLNQIRTKIENDWCFYYQLANRQAAEQKWSEVLVTYSDAEKLGMMPVNFNDYLPKLEASLRQNPLPISLEFSNEINSSPEQKDIICRIWNDYQMEPDLNEEVISGIKDIKIELACHN